MSNEEKLINQIFGSTPQPNALRFSLTLDGYVVDVAIRKKKEMKKCGCDGCSKECMKGAKNYETK